MMTHVVSARALGEPHARLELQDAAILHPEEQRSCVLEDMKECRFY